MNDLIVEYILHHISLKGSMVVCFDGKKIYYKNLIKHIEHAFNLDCLIANGYVSGCVFMMDDDFSYSHWALQTPLLDWGSDSWVPQWEGETRADRYIAAIDPAMGDDATVMNFLVRTRMGVTIIQQDMLPIVDLPIP